MQNTLKDIIYIFTFFLYSFPFFCYSQIQPGQWREHFSYNNGNYLAFGNQKIFCATPTGIFSFNQENYQIEKLSRVNGLTDIDISAINYSENYNILAVGYISGNIDLVLEDRIVKIPDIKNKLMQGSKRINHLFFYNDILYVSTDFAVVAVDFIKHEIKDTYYIGIDGDPEKVNSTLVYQNTIYAATANGLQSADINDPLLTHFERWTLLNGFTNPSNACIDISVFQNKIIAIESTPPDQKDIIWAFDSFGWQEVGQDFNNVLHIRTANNKLTITSQEGIAIYNSLGLTPTIVSNYGFAGSFDPEMTLPLENNKFSIADKNLGMVYGELGSFYQVLPNGPVSNKVFSVGVSTDKVVVAAGAYDATYTNRWFQYSFHTFQNQEWKSLVDWHFHDAVRVLFNPANQNEYYVASWGHGVFRYQGDVLKRKYDWTNSTLQSIYPNEPYCRISGMTFDDKGNLWVANSMVPNPISVRKKDTTWVSFAYSNQINSEWFSDLVYSPSGSLWLILPRGDGLFALDPGNDINSMNDDKFKKLKPVDRNGNSLPSDINSLVFDKDGYMWLGTTEGVLISYNHEKVFDNSAYFQRVKIPDIVQGLAAYLLEKESVTTIAVDGGNQKWFGTNKSGVFLQSPDGTEEIIHFNTQNSPLPSDNILDIKVHPTTGEVFITTEKGLISFRGVATEPSDLFKKVYVYPNPVRPSFSGDIIVTGLVTNTNVKITDISGNLVFESTSLGGQVAWDGRNLNGNKVATGVYLVFCVDSTGEQTAITKLLFVK